MSEIEIEIEPAEVEVEDAVDVLAAAVLADEAAAPEGYVDVSLDHLDGPSGFGGLGDLAPVLDVPVELTVEIGRTTMTIGETLSIGPGSIVSLNRAIGEPVDLLVNGKRIARGEVVAVDEEFGLRVTEVEPAESRLDAGL
jgi:flagellar motor switch protein FliN